MRRTLGLGRAAANVVIGCLLAGPTWAQVSTATLSVETFAGEAVPLPGVAVVATNRDTGLDRRGVTDARARVILQALPPGAYEVTAELEGFAPVTDPECVLRVGQTVLLRLTLRPQVEGTLEVSGEAPLVDVYRTDSSTNIVPEQIQALPVPDRKFERLAFITPGVSREHTEWLNLTGAPVVGSTSHAMYTAYLVDGGDLTDPFFGLSRVKFSQDSIREFRVSRQGIDAEIGGSAGGALSVVTKSGGNQVRGSVYGFYRADALRAAGALERDEVKYERTHLGFTLGGPIARDRTHYFVSVEHLDENGVAAVRPLGAFTDLAEDVDNPVEQTTLLASLSHRFTPASTGTAKLVGERYREDNYQVGGVIDQSQGWDFNRDNWNLLLGNTWVINDGILNEVRLQGGAGDFGFASNSDAIGEWFSFGNTLRTGSHFLAHPDNLYDARYAEVRDTLLLQVAPRHSVKAGVSLWHLDQVYKEERYANGWMYYADDVGTPYLYLYGVGSSRVDYDNDILGVFIQDKWQVADNATLSLGLRYDLEREGNNPGFEHPLVGDRSRDTDNIQPRLGFAWDLGGDGRTVLRGGAGRYVGRLQLLPALYELMFNGVTGRVQLRNYHGPLLGLPDYPLDPADPEHTGVPVPPFIELLADDLEAPESTQVSLGLGRRLGSSGLSADLEWLYVEGDNETVYRDTNWKGNDDPCMADPAVSCRIDPSWSGIQRYTSEGRSRYWAATASLNGTLRGGHLIAASFTVSEKSNLGDEPVGMNYPSDPADIEAEWGRSRADERYRVVVSGVFRLPWRVTVAPFFEYGSGQTWTRILGYDANLDGWGTDREQGVGRNDQDGPPFRQLNLRLSKTVALRGSGELELIVEVFNLFNTTNYAVTSVSNAQYLVVYDSGTGLQFPPNPDFGTYTATHPPREVQLGLRYSF